MCVVCIVDNTRPTDKMVAQMYQANKYGAGIAWREKQKLKGKKAEESVVRWKKGLDLEEIQELVRTLPIPFIAHFRIPSCGPDVKELNHPFPITEGAEMYLDGVIPGWVLFHNGTWHRWKDMLFDSCLKAGIKIPKGPWSDTRAMALVVKKLGLHALEFIDERTVAFGPEKGDCRINGNGWSRVAVDGGIKKEGVLVSNEGWTNVHVSTACSVTDDDYADEMAYGGMGHINLMKKCHYTNTHDGACTSYSLCNGIYCFEHNTHEKRTACEVKAFEAMEKKQETPTPVGTFSVVKLGGASSSAERTFPPTQREAASGHIEPEKVEERQTDVETGTKEDGKADERISVRAARTHGSNGRIHSSVIIVDEKGKARREPLIIGDDTSSEGLPRWAGSFNPKRLRGHTGQSLDDLQLDARRRARDAGITIQGSL